MTSRLHKATFRSQISLHFHSKTQSMENTGPMDLYLGLMLFWCG
jgi:hypothetical protein